MLNGLQNLGSMLASLPNTLNGFTCRHKSVFFNNYSLCVRRVESAFVCHTVFWSDNDREIFNLSCSVYTLRLPFLKTTQMYLQ